MIEWERRDGFMPFQRAVAQRESQTASTRIWIQIIDFISSVDNHNTKRISPDLFVCLFVCLCVYVEFVSSFHFNLLEIREATQSFEEWSSLL